MGKPAVDPTSVKYLSPEDVCELIPGMTKNRLARLRYDGVGPPFRTPTPKTVIYREDHIFNWVEGTEKTITSS